MTDPVVLFFAGVVGLALGSFLNVCVARWPHRVSVARPRSACPACSTPIRWHDLIPVVSWLALGARCRACRAPISPTYPLVEVAAAAICAVMVLTRGVSLEAVSGSLFLLILLGIALTDARHYLIPDPFSLGGAAAGLALALAPGGITPGSATLGAALGFGGMWLVGAGGTWMLVRARPGRLEEAGREHHEGRRRARDTWLVRALAGAGGQPGEWPARPEEAGGKHHQGGGPGRDGRMVRTGNGSGGQPRARSEEEDRQDRQGRPRAGGAGTSGARSGGWGRLAAVMATLMVVVAGGWGAGLAGAMAAVAICAAGTALLVAWAEGVGVAAADRAPGARDADAHADAHAPAPAVSASAPAGAHAAPGAVVGGGDVKMMALMGAFTGPWGVVLTVFGAALAGSVAYLALRAVAGTPQLIPFGVFLAAGGVTTLVWGDAIVSWYLTMAGIQ